MKGKEKKNTIVKRMIFAVAARICGWFSYAVSERVSRRER